MLNLVRMDFYRLIRSKSFYACLAFLLTTIFMCYGIIFIVGTPEGQQLAPKIGMSMLVDAEDSENSESVLEGVDFISMLRQSCTDGGAYHLTFGIMVAIFICMDFQSGFIKNIMSMHRKRWKYVISKLLTIGIADFSYLVICFAFAALMNLLFHNLVPFGRGQDVLFYLSWVWLVTMAFAALIIMLCVISKNMAVGVTMAVLLGSGLILLPLVGITSWFNADGWFHYTIYYNISYGPSSYSVPADLKVFAIGAVFLAIYSIIAVIVSAKRDVA